MKACDWCGGKFELLGRHQAHCRRNPAMAASLTRRLVAYRSDLLRVAKEIELDAPFAPPLRKYSELGRYQPKLIISDATIPPAHPSWGRAVKRLGFQPVDWIEYDKDGKVKRLRHPTEQEILADLSLAAVKCGRERIDGVMVGGFLTRAEYLNVGQFHPDTVVKYLVGDGGSWSDVGRLMGHPGREGVGGRIPDDRVMKDYRVLATGGDASMTLIEFDRKVPYSARHIIPRRFGSFEEFVRQATTPPPTREKAS